MRIEIELPNGFEEYAQKQKINDIEELVCKCLVYCEEQEIDVFSEISFNKLLKELNLQDSPIEKAKLALMNADMQLREAKVNYERATMEYKYRLKEYNLLTQPKPKL